MKRILFYAVYPAPYRAELIDIVSKGFDSIVFYDSSTGSSRHKDYFSKGEFNFLNEHSGKKKFENCKKRIIDFDLVFIYDFATKNALSLINKCIKNKVPYVLNSDGVLLYNHGNFVKNIIKKRIIKNSTACVASGEYAKNYFIKYGARSENIFIHNFSSLHESQILTNLISDEQKVLIRKKYKLPEDKIIVVGVGRFIPLKQYDLLLQNWNKVPENIVLLLIGGGELKNKYTSIIKENLLDNVIIDDFRPYREIYEIFQASDIFVHPTSYDCWGLVINEAMANGLPVVVSNMCIAGLELINDSINGYVVDYQDFDKMTLVIKDLASNKKLRTEMAKNNLKKITNFTIEYMANVHMQVIRKITDKTIK